MDGRCYLSIDLGTTAVKVALFRTDGALLALSIRELSLSHPAPEQMEIDPRRLWQAVATGTREVLAEARKAGAPAPAGIGLSSQAQTFVLLDERGEPVRPAVMWLDSRAAEEAEEFSRRFTPEETLRQIGRRSVTAVASAPKLRWLSKYEPDCLARARTLLLLPDYLLYRLTGERVTDPVTAASTGLFHPFRRRWWPEGLAFAGAQGLALPVVRGPGEPAGRLRAESASELDLPEGILCAVGTNDQLTGALGAGNVEVGTVSETTGTALALVLTAGPEASPPDLSGPHPAGDHLRYLMAYSKTAGIVLKWFRDHFWPGASYERIFEAIAAVPIGAEGVTCLPHFSGTASPTFNPRAAGAFAGLRLSHTPAHLARAIVEALTFDLRMNLARLKEWAGSVKGIRAMGGGARSDLWLEMKADVVGLPVERVACAEAASLGAAELAMVAAGEFASVREASLALYRSDRTFEPDPSRAARYAEPFERYRELRRRLYQEGKG